MEDVRHFRGDRSSGLNAPQLTSAGEVIVEVAHPTTGEKQKLSLRLGPKKGTLSIFSNKGNFDVTKGAAAAGEAIALLRGASEALVCHGLDSRGSNWEAKNVDRFGKDLLDAVNSAINPR